MVDALFLFAWEFESNTVRQWNRTPRGAVRDLPVRLKTRNQGWSGI